MSLRDMFSRSKKKRTLTPTRDPNESYHSFVNNVKSHVSRLVPARISQWFSSSPAHSTGNGSIVSGDCTDSSEDEPDPLPPAKRKRYNTEDTQYNQCFQMEPTPFHSESSEIPNRHNVLYTSIQSAPGRNTYTRDANYATSTRFMSNADELSAEASTSQTTTKEASYKASQIPSTSGQSVATKRKSIFENVEKDEDVKNTNKSCAQASTSLSDVRPRFRPSLYGSPFYPGRTMYGGASASTYINRPIINHQKVTKVRESRREDSSSLSSPTRKILDLLENCSSPLVEAKRIPVLPNRNHSLSHSRPSPRKSDSYKMQELNVPGIASIMRVKQRSRLMDTTKAARQLLASYSSTQPEYSLASNTTERTTGKDTLKMNTRLTRGNRGDDSSTMPEPVQLPTAVLHIDKDNLPKFSITSPSTKAQVSSETNTMFTNILAPNSYMFKFASPAVSPVAMSQDLEMVNNITSGIDQRNIDESKAREETSQPNIFQKVDTPVIASTFGRYGSTGWKCSDCWVNNKAEAVKCVACGGKRPSTGDDQGQLTPAPVSTALDTRGVEEDWKCDNCWIKNKSSVKKCAACGGSKPGGKENASSVAAPLMFNCKTPAEVWSCKSCWITNKINMEKCEACGNPKPVAKDGTTSTSTLCVTQPETDWKCDNCWIKNKSSVKKCAACGGTKPGATGKEHAKPESVPETHSLFCKPPDDKLQEIIRAQKNKWECSGCLTRNDPDKTKCQCCEMEREGHSKELTSKPFTFPKESNINFKFGIDPKEQEKNLAKKAEEDAKVGLTILEKTETYNNNTYIKLPMTTSIDNKSKEQKPSENKNEDKADSVVPEGPTESFSFGTLKSGQMKPSAPAIVPSVNKPIDNLKPIHGNFTFGTGFLAPPKSEQGTQQKNFPSFVNNSIDKSQRSTTDPTAVSLPNINVSNNDKDNNIAFSFSNVSGNKPKQVTFGGATGEGASSSTTSPFTFGTSQAAPASTVATTPAPLFSTPIAAVASTISAPLFTITPSVATTATPTGSLFSSQPAPAISTTQFSNPQTISTTAAQSSSLFSNPQPTTAASEPSAGSIFGATQPVMTAASASPAAPLFSLKNNGSNASSAPFSFGSTNNDNKSPFGSSNNNDNKASPFGSANNNDNRASPFGTRFNSTFTLGTASAQPGAEGSGTGGVGSSMSGVNDPGTAASSAGFSTQESTWSKGDTTFGTGSAGVARNATPFAFGAVGNQFQASGTAASGSTTKLFGAQPASGSQGVFGMSNTGGSGSGLFGSTIQSAQPSNIFGAQTAPSLFGAQNQPTPFGATAPTQPTTFGAPASTQPPAFGATQSQSSVFGAPAQNQSSVFGAPSQNQSPAFGVPAQNQPSAFGAPAQSQPPTFGVPTQNQPPAFGAPTQSQPSAFGAPSQSQQPTFGAPSQSQPPAYGAPSQSQPPAFGAPSQSQSPAFGAPSQSQPSAFGAPAQPAPAPAPAFNFGTPVFSFGQQAHQQSQPPPVYSFGGMSAGMTGGLISQPMDGGLGGGAQFNVGSSPAAAGAAGTRRIRKAMRRTSQR